MEDVNGCRGRVVAAAFKLELGEGSELNVVSAVVSPIRSVLEAAKFRCNNPAEASSSNAFISELHLWMSLIVPSGQNRVRIESEEGQKRVKRGSKESQNRVKRGSKEGQYQITYTRNTQY